MTEPRIALREAQSYLGIAGDVSGGIPAFVDDAFPELFGRLGERGIAPAAAPFIRFLELDDDGEPVLIEVGVPVDGSAEGDDRVQAGVVPAGRYLTLVHEGPYRHDTIPDLAHSRRRLLAWADEHGVAHTRGREPACALEQYHVGPPMEPDFSKWRTEFAYLVL